MGEGKEGIVEDCYFKGGLEGFEVWCCDILVVVKNGEFDWIGWNKRHFDNRYWMLMMLVHQVWCGELEKSGGDAKALLVCICVYHSVDMADSSIVYFL